MSNDIDLLGKYLEYSHMVKATDLHLCAGSMPLVRVNGQLMAIPGTDKMMPDAISQLLDTLLSDSQKKNSKKKEFWISRLPAPVWADAG